MTVGSDGTAYITGFRAGLPVIRAFGSDGQPNLNFANGGELSIYAPLGIGIGSSLPGYRLIPIQKGGQEEILAIYHVKTLPSISALKFIHFNSAGQVTYTSPSIVLPKDRVINDFKAEVSGSTVYIGYDSTFTVGGNGGIVHVAFLKSDIYGQLDSSYGDNGLLSLSGALNLGSFVITSSNKIAMLAGASSSMACYIIDGTPNPPAYTYYNTYNGRAELVLKNNYIYAVIGTHKLFRLTEDCQTQITGPIDLGISGPTLLSLKDTGSSTLSGFSVNYSTREVTRFQIDSTNLTFSSGVVATLPLESNHANPQSYYMSLKTDKLYFLGYNSKDNVSLGTNYDPVLNVLDMNTWNFLGSYFFQDTSVDDLNNYLVIVRESRGDLFAFGQYDDNRQGYKSILAKLQPDGNVDKTFATQGYWTSGAYLMQDILELSTGEYLLSVRRSTDNQSGFLKIDHSGQIVTSFATAGFYPLPASYYFNTMSTPPFEVNGVLYITALAPPLGKLFLIDINTGAATVVDTKVTIDIKKLDNGSVEIRDIRQVSAGNYELRRLVYDGTSLNVLQTTPLSMSGILMTGFYSDDQFSFINAVLDTSDSSNYKATLICNQFDSSNQAIVNPNSSVLKEHVAGVGSYFIKIGTSIFGYGITFQDGVVDSQIYRFKDGSWSQINIDGVLVATYAAHSESEVYILTYALATDGSMVRKLRKVSFLE